jgi:hypothetical protein
MTGFEVFLLITVLFTGGLNLYVSHINGKRITLHFDHLMLVSDAVLKLQSDLDAKIEEVLNPWLEEQDKERAELREFNRRHHETVEGYLEYFQSLNKPVPSTGKK